MYAALGDWDDYRPASPVDSDAEDVPAQPTTMYVLPPCAFAAPPPLV